MNSYVVAVPYLPSLLKVLKVSLHTPGSTVYIPMFHLLNYNAHGDISGSRGGEYEDRCLLRYCVVQSSRTD